VGIIKTIKPHTDKSGKSMAFGTLEDYNGSIDIVFFNRAWENYGETIKPEAITALKGKIDQTRGKPSLQVSSVPDLKKLAKAAAANPEAASGQNAPPSGTAAAAKTAAGNMAAQSLGFREIHIRLQGLTAEKNLYPLRDFLIDNPGSSPVFIHVPAAGENGGGETVIRTAIQLSIAGDREHLEKIENYSAVAEAWGA
jgi:DNA polymerase-3 subunit alpha